MLVVGCPVVSREWILKRWSEHIIEAARRAQVGPVTWAFAVPEDDVGTRGVIAGLPGEALVVLTDEPVRADERSWGDLERYRHMAEIRNRLLETVRGAAPDWFWSVDSDILVNPDALTSALALTPRFDIVGSKCYLSEMTPGFINFGMWHPGAGGLVRYESEGQHPVDIVMAAKLMSSAAYAVDYVYHHQGEDVGYSLACRDAGLRLGWDGSLVSRHVARPELLDPEVEVVV